MRVALVDPGPFTPESDARTAEALAAAGCEVTLFTAPFVHGRLGHPSGYLRREIFARLLGRGVTRRLAAVGPLRRSLRALAYPFDWRRLARETAGRADVVHLLWSLDPARDASRLARLRQPGTSAVVTVHNPAPRPGDRARGTRLAPLLAAADAVVVHSAASRAELTARHGRPERIHLVPPAVVVRPLDAERRRAARARLDLPQSSPLALFHGLLRPYKGVEVLIEAFATVLRRIPEARLLIAGAPRQPLGPLRRSIAAAGMAAQVRLEPRYLGTDEVEERFAAADVVVLPYLAASQSGVLADALGYARAVVATRVGGLPEMVEDGATGRLVAAGDAAGLAAAVGDLLAEPALARELGAAGAALAARRFAPERQAHALTALYRELEGA